MVGNTGTLMSIRIVRSKLRKRDESSSGPEAVTVQTTTNPPFTPNSMDMQNRSSLCNGGKSEHEHMQIDNHTRSATVNFEETVSSESSRNITFVRTNGGPTSMPSNSWVFPPKAPTPHIYNCMNDAILSDNDKNGFRGFRKQFSGRFKRLVSKKTEPASTIPPELKPQLKTIYVY